MDLTRLEGGRGCSKNEAVSQQMQELALDSFHFLGRNSGLLVKNKMYETNFASKVSTLDLLQAGDREPNHRTDMETCHCTSSVSHVDEQCPTRFFQKNSDLIIFSLFS